MNVFSGKKIKKISDFSLKRKKGLKNQLISYVILLKNTMILSIGTKKALEIKYY